MYFNGSDETKHTTFSAKVEKGQLAVNSKYAGVKSGLVMEAKPGKESYLKKKQTKRSIEVKSASIRKFGTATITDVTIGGVAYNLNKDKNKLERTPPSDKPIILRHGARITYSGTMMNAGVPRSFSVTTQLNFKKK